MRPREGLYLPDARCSAFRIDDAGMEPLAGPGIWKASLQGAILPGFNAACPHISPGEKV